MSVKSIKKNEKTTWLLIIPILIVSPKRLKKSLGEGGGTLKNIPPCGGGGTLKNILPCGGGDSEKYTPLFQEIIE